MATSDWFGLLVHSVKGLQWSGHFFQKEWDGFFMFFPFAGGVSIWSKRKLHMQTFYWTASSHEASKVKIWQVKRKTQYQSFWERDSFYQSVFSLVFLTHPPTSLAMRTICCRCAIGAWRRIRCSAPTWIPVSTVGPEAQRADASGAVGRAFANAWSDLLGCLGLSLAGLFRGHRSFSILRLLEGLEDLQVLWD